MLSSGGSLEGVAPVHGLSPTLSGNITIVTILLYVFRKLTEISAFYFYSSFRWVKHKSIDSFLYNMIKGEAINMIKLSDIKKSASSSSGGSVGSIVMSESMPVSEGTWHLCDGSVLDKVTYSELYNKIGGCTAAPKFSLVGTTGIACKSVCYGNALYVGVGSAGKSSTSPDGITWTLKSTGMGTSYSINSVCYGNGTYMFAAQLGIIYSSTIETSWTVRTSHTTSDLYSVVYGNGVFVAVGDSGTITSSTGGVTWAVRTSGTSYPLRAVTYGSGKFVAVGDYGVYSMSTNGTAWFSGTGTTFASSSYPICICYGDKFVAVGSSGRIATSTDGTTWTGRASGGYF